MNNQTVIKRINSLYDTLSKGRKKIADFILVSGDKAANMTAAGLAFQVGVSEATAVRFAGDLGYNGYPEFQKALKQYVSTRLTAAERIEFTKLNLKRDEILPYVFSSDINKLKNTLAAIDRESFDASISSILKAKKIYIIGVRSASYLAGFLGFNLNFIFDNVETITANAITDLFEQLINIGKDDVIIGISFPRYSRRTVNALKYAGSCGATVVALTDSKNSPLNEYADYSLYAMSDMASFADSLVAPLSLINSIIVALASLKGEEVSNKFLKLESIWDEYDVYDK